MERVGALRGVFTIYSKPRVDAAFETKGSILAFKQNVESFFCDVINKHVH